MIGLREVIERNAALYPDAIHSVFEGRQLSFRQFADRVRRLTSGLYKLGMRHQDRVAILAMNCTEYLEVFGAAEFSGFVATTVNWRLTASEIAYVLRDAVPRALIFESQYVSIVDALRTKLTSIEHWICVGADVPVWAQPYEAVIADGDAAGAPLRPSPDDLLCLIYTSGTTGRPKGCMLSHHAHAFMADQSAAYQAMLPGDRALVIAPLFHVGARSQQLPMHLRGGTVVLLRLFDAEEVLRTIEAERITHVHMVPTMVQSLLDLPNHKRYDTSSLKCIIYAAAPMPLPVLRRAIDRFGRILINGWGLTEGGNGSVLPQHLHRPDGSNEDIVRLASVGQPAVGTEVIVADDDGHELPRGQVGELLVRSASNMMGYWNNHPATVEALRGGWLRTGDVGRMDELRFVFLVDRKKDMIITGGENVYCREVEEALIEHPGLADVAVIGVPNDRWGEAVKAVAVRSSESTVTEAELIEHCRRLIAGYKCPKSIDFVDALPRLTSGKISKVELRRSYAKANS
ncbi:long-chain-fatty-acid--CoA ligase [Paraburkholderia sp. BL10I2N1]|uniref:long-chain-fatty-acid--CoA ligase n=1 Tax=Paraburkholderia sp. BL10I2N1 TaxID=1938796 RepID=UPI00105DED52|nr:long-chain-fatty-acid--CoA ligase [Paraburkholderia sp. BL10I2N1]TDN59176.1 acyl-CoA synthetase (AMP-forming)/AMP-acid ligase II [Paraburkholderia sp. BL10I2N1]